MTSFVSARIRTQVHDNLLLQFGAKKPRSAYVYIYIYCRSLFRHRVRLRSNTQKENWEKKKKKKYTNRNLKARAHRVVTWVISNHISHYFPWQPTLYNYWRFQDLTWKCIIREKPHAQARGVTLQIVKSGPCITRNKWLSIWGLALWRLSRSDVE